MTSEEVEALLVELQAPDGTWVEVGLITRHNERTGFESFPAYWELADRPVLAQALEEGGRTWRPTARVALPPWFSHLLPEGLLREAVADAAGVKAEREFPLLARIGHDDLPGALRIRPADVEGSPLPEEIEDGPDGDEQRHADAAVLKFSLAGVQLKFSMTARDHKLTLPAKGQAGDVIVKLPDRRVGFEGVPEAELAGLTLALAAGIPTPEAWLVDLTALEDLPGWATAGDAFALAIRRFDRTDDGRRVHMEELAQVLGVPAGDSRAKYRRLNFETVARATGALVGPDAVGDVIDRVVLNVLFGNGDAHAKNWAFRYEDGRTPRLSSAYDVVPTVLYLPDDDLGLKLAGSRRFRDVTLESFEYLALKAGWSREAGRRRAIEAVQRVDEAWPVLADHLPPSAVEKLNTHRHSLRLLP